ncbi:hypothetical protein PpBr36_07291 [Pyricularia pennisetigena]|uniref:hypothetical protein n=1 Tax=Pyricularia pennisetigena TaxID=1578925 RepID=UPI0011518CA1|nr:hypothetical protein PpBr36_07291 [Pyricularia pennisetigena]TLS25043.1 hypothetical protein PpBr36_07291 [Pyricularia pennisetigena]
MLSFRNPFVTSTSKKTAEASQKEPHGLFVLYPTSEDKVDSNCLEADIVAVHGLNGDARKTWTDPESGKFWLEDFLPERAKMARIMTFGYDSKLALSKSKAGVETFSRELLGKLRLLRMGDEKAGRQKAFQALIMAYMELVNYGDILDSTVGIVFMGTPHRGSDLASWGLVLTSLINTASLGTGLNKELLKTLKANSEMLAGISSQFVHRATPLKIRTFTEQQVERPLTTLVVPESSAIIGLPNEIVLPLNANHRSMCRFASSDSDNYKIVEDTIMEILTRRQKAERQTNYSASLSFISQPDAPVGNMEDKVFSVTSAQSSHKNPGLANSSFISRSISVASPAASQTHAPVALSATSFAASSSLTRSNTVLDGQSQDNCHELQRKFTSTTLSTPKPKDTVIRIHGLKKRLTPETYGEDEFSYDFCLPGDTLVENLGKELLKKIPDLKTYTYFVSHRDKREPIDPNWVDKFTSPVEITHGRSCANPKKGFKINIDQPIAAFFSRAFPRPLQAVRKADLAKVAQDANLPSGMNMEQSKAGGIDDAEPPVFADAIAFGRDIDEPDLAISFMRTARLPWCDEKYQLPPAIGSFPLFDVQKFADRMPSSMVAQGGIFMPIYQTEAFWINFIRIGQKTPIKFAVRPFVGGVNTISGQALHCATMDTTLPKKKLLAKNQDYLVSPDQKRLDGTSVEPGVVRQFVATEMVSASRRDYLAAKNTESEDGKQDEETPAGASVEWQVTGNDEFGGLQLQIIPAHDVQSIHAGSEENNLFLRGEGQRRYDVLKTPREQGLVAGDVIYIKDLKSLLPRRQKMLSDLVDELPANERRNNQGRHDGQSGRAGVMVEMEVARSPAVLETFDISDQGNGDNNMRLQFDVCEDFNDVEGVIISKMGYQNTAVIIFCVWRRKNRKPGIVRVQTWEDVRSGTPRIEPETGQTSARKVWDMIIVPTGSMPESDYIVEASIASRTNEQYTNRTTPTSFCMVLNSESTLGHLRSELQHFLGHSVAGTAFTAPFWASSDSLDDGVQLKVLEPKVDRFMTIRNGQRILGLIHFLAGPGIDSSKACEIPRAGRDNLAFLGHTGLLGRDQTFPNQLDEPKYCLPGIYLDGRGTRQSFNSSYPQFAGYNDPFYGRNVSRPRYGITVQHGHEFHIIEIPLNSLEERLSFLKLRLLVLTGIQPRNQVLRRGGQPIADTHRVRYLMGTPITLTTQPPTLPTALGIAAGGKIEQHIEPDHENPRMWDVGSSKMLSVQLLDSHTFKTVTGLDPPPTPLGPEKYAELGLAFRKAWRDELKGPGVSGRAEDGTWGGVSSLEGPMEVAARNAGVQIPAAGEADGGERSYAGLGVDAAQGRFFEAAADFPVLLEDVDDAVSQFKSAMEADLEDDWSD